MAKNGTPSRKTRNAAWRVMEKREPRITGSSAGSVMCVRPALLVNRLRASSIRPAAARRTTSTSTAVQV